MVVAVELVDDKIGAVHDAVGIVEMAHGVVDAVAAVPYDDDPGIEIVEIGAGKS